MEKASALSFCGLDCASCPVFVATKKGDAPLRRRTARSWSRLLDLKLTEADMVCEGCRSDTRFPHCANCEIKACCAEKRVDNCASCAERKTCARINGFREFFSEHKREFLWRD